MIISVINHTHDKISDEEAQRVLRAINRQIREDFEPYWSLGARLRLEGRHDAEPDRETLADMRGEGVIYLWDGSDVDDAIGYHDANHAGIPFGFVFTDIAEALGEPWSVTLSHEALELIGDPEVNLLAAGPHPKEKRVVFHWYEMCDAVQAETYDVDGVEVSNFVLPLYFTGSEERGGRNDFLGRSHGGKTLRSFGVNPGGYVGFFDPALGKHDTYALTHDGLAAKRMAIKRRVLASRRSGRYQRFRPTNRAAHEPTARRAPGRSRALARRPASVRRR